MVAVLLALGSGYAVFALITRYVYHVCPACAASHFDEATAHRFSEIAAAMMLALSVHCTADGLALAAGQEAHAAHAPGGRLLDVSLVMAVCVHKVPRRSGAGRAAVGGRIQTRPGCASGGRRRSDHASGRCGGLDHVVTPNFAREVGARSNDRRRGQLPQA
ncbi:MAG TPA: hypothetical protein VMU04_17075 [Candidatus Acidoferrum sp.]|nr:hypothetical protein [Candidatus Acidoferrum sp.]